MMMFDGAGDSRDYLGAVQYSAVQYSTVQYSARDSRDYLGAVFIIVSISAAGGAGAGVPWDRQSSL